MPTPRSSPYLHLMDLAKGGLGQVSLVARTEGDFKRVYAMKRLHAHLQDAPSVRRMFVEEARIAGLLRHANVTSVLDVGEDEHGPFLIMDFVDGVSLTEIFRKFQWPDPIPLEVSLAIASQTARGLHAAHELRQPDGTPMTVVHRDVTPSNILVGFDGVVRVTDFGVAKSFGTSPETTQGVLKGKLAYMPPEQLRFQEVDKRSDLYSLGVVLYEMVAGQRLFKGESAQTTALRIVENRVPDISEIRADLPPSLVELIYELLAYAREQRPETAADVADRLNPIQRDLEPCAQDTTIERFVKEHFDALRSERERSIAQALDVMASGRDSTTGQASSFSVSTAAPAKRTPRKTARWVSLGLLLLMSAITIAAIVHSGRNTSAAPNPTPLPPLLGQVDGEPETAGRHVTASAPLEAPANPRTSEAAIPRTAPISEGIGSARPAESGLATGESRSARRGRRRRSMRRPPRSVATPAVNMTPAQKSQRDRDWWPR